MDAEAAESFEEAIRRDGRYPPAAYEFLHHGLEHTARRVHRRAPRARPRHVSGRQLCEGLRAVALQRWGALAPVVLGRWNIHATRDFGEMVFLLIKLGLMGKQESDRLSDFDEVYDFDQAFDAYEVPIDTLDE